MNYPCIAKDHARSEVEWVCVIFMACSCPSFVPGHLEEETEKINGENLVLHARLSSMDESGLQDNLGECI